MAACRSARTHVGWFTKLSLTLILMVVLRQHAKASIKSLIAALKVNTQKVARMLCLSSFTINFNPVFCLPRTLCGKGVGETCRKYGEINDCKPGLYCNCDHLCSENLIICSSFGSGLLDWNMKN